MTRTARSYALAQASDTLHELGFKGVRATGLRRKHVVALVREWKRQGRSIGTMKNRTTHIRWWAKRVSRPGVVPANGELGIANMDEAGIGIQVLSAVTPDAQNLPGAEGVAFARKLNDRIAHEVVAAYPDRLPRLRHAAARRAPGGGRRARARGRRARLRRLHELRPHRRPVLRPRRLRAGARPRRVTRRADLPPNWPSREVMAAYYDGLGDPLASKILGGSGYDWHQEVALQCLRLIVGGTFDRFPGLQIVVGHMGEGLSFWYWRVGEDLNRIAKDRLHKPVQWYFHDNLWITTSAFFRDELLALALATLGEDRIMFSVDYPMASATAGADWIRALDLPRATKEKIAHRNARRLLGIGPV